MKRYFLIICIFLVSFSSACTRGQYWEKWLEDYEDVIEQYREQDSYGQAQATLIIKLNDKETEAIDILEELEASDPESADKFREKLLLLYYKYGLIE